MLLAERAESERLRQIIKELQRHRFGRRAKSLPEDQLQLALEEAEQVNSAGQAEAEETAPAERKTRAAGRRTNRGSLPAHLPRIETVVDVASTVCPCCSGKLHRIGEDVSERLDIVPAQFRVLVVRRPKYACRACEDVVVQAPAPARLIEGGIPTEATVAQVLVSKYADHLPLYWQAQIYARQGVTLDRSTLADWVGRAAFLLRPVHARLLQKLKASSKLFADETTAPVLDPGRGQTKTGQLWAYARDDRPWGGGDPPGVAYVCGCRDMEGGDLQDLRRAETGQAVAAPIAAIAEAARARHGGAVAAVLFYGSCLRLGSDVDRIVDLYLVVDGYAAVYGRGLTAMTNRLLPPNVYYIETPFDGRRVRAKCAVVSLADFEKGAGGRWFHPYLWARFAQPCRLAWCRDAATRARVTAALAGSAHKCLAEGLALVGNSFTSEELWVALFRETYRSELRAEPPGRAAEIHAADAGHYAQLAALELPNLGARPTAAAGSWTAPARTRGGNWALRRVQGKLLSVVRLVKAAFTFTDGAQYLLWKIERHSGVGITLTPWQRRHPVLASTVLFWRLYRKGAFR